MLVFEDCLKTFTTDQDKAIRPEDTLKRFYAKVKTLDCVILNEVKRIDNGRLDIPVYFSICGDDARALTGTKKQMGKGRLARPGRGLGLYGTGRAVFLLLVQEQPCQFHHR